MIEYLFIPERREFEDMDTYKQRRKLANEVARSMRRGLYPTRFVHHHPNLEKKRKEQQ